MQKNIKQFFIYSILFVLVSIIAKAGLFEKIDKSFQSGFYDCLDNDLITNFALFLTNYTLGTVLGVGAVALLFAFKKHFYAIISLGITFIGLYISQSVLKLLIERPRPFISDSNIIFLGSKIPDGFSYPSGHTLIAVFLATVLAYKFKESMLIVTISYTIAGLVGLSRIYLGAHFPIDVLGGLFLGLMFGHIAILMDNFLIISQKRSPRFSGQTTRQIQ